jgi:hypothetical protein
MPRCLPILCLLFLPAFARADGEPLSEGSAAVAALVEQLSDEDFARRQRAEEQLLLAGPQAIAALVASSGEGEPERSARATAVLERMFVHGCLAVADDAERALETLASAERPDVAQRARAVLVGNQQLRERRAIAALRELGAKVDELPSSENEMLLWPQMLGRVEGPLTIPGQPPVKWQIWLLEDWQGGEEGLWHIARLEDNWGLPLWGLTLYQVKGNGVPIEAVQRLAARVPKLEIHLRGASLGISSREGEPCMVWNVLENSPAGKAGIIEGDIIRGFNGESIDRFSDLVGKLVDRTPGESVTIHVQRQGAILELPVKLGGWREVKTDRGSSSAVPQWIPPPQPLPDLNPDDVFREKER